MTESKAFLKKNQKRHKSVIFISLFVFNIIIACFQRSSLEMSGLFCKSFLIILLSGCLSMTYAQVATPKYSNEFLSIGVGARAFGMANAQVGVTSDVTSAYWNPAGLVEIENKYDVGLMHAEYFAGIAKYDYVGVATPLDSNSHLGITAIRFGIDDIPDTRNLFDENGNINYDNVQFFSTTDYAFLLSYAKRTKLLGGLQLGGNFKVIYRNIGDFANAWGFGLDVGAKLKKDSWVFGANFRDVTTTFNAWTFNTELLEDVYAQTGNEIPSSSIELTLPKLLLGTGKSWLIKGKYGILAALDLDVTFDGKRNVLIKSDPISIDPHAGVELDYKKIVYLRIGIGNYQRIKDFDGGTYGAVQPNFGVGVKIKSVMIDYALTDVGNVSEALFSNIFSLKVSFDEIK